MGFNLGYKKLKKGRICFPCWESNRDSSDVTYTLVTILTELSRLNRKHVLDTKRCSKFLSLQSLLLAMCARLAQSLVCMLYTCCSTVALRTFFSRAWRLPWPGIDTAVILRGEDLSPWPNCQPTEEEYLVFPGTSLKTYPTWASLQGASLRLA